MHQTRRHVRSALAALAVVCLSAGIAAAHEMPGASDAGRAIAADAAGRAVPVGHPEATHPATQVPASKPATADDEASEADRADNHGWFVSGAAKADTPDGFENHGDHVSSIAKDGAGKPEAATAGQERADAAPGRAASAEAKGKPKPTGD